MSNEVLKEKLSIKIEKEFNKFKQDLLKNAIPENIFDKAYEITFKEQIKDIVNNMMFDKEELKILLKTDNIIDKLYSHWEKSEGYIWEGLEDNVNGKIGNIIRNYHNKEKER